MATTALKEPTTASAYVMGAACAAGALLFLLGAASTHDSLFAIQSWTFVAGFAAILVWLVRRIGHGTAGADETQYMDDVIRAGVIASMFWGLAGLLVGVIIASQLAWPSLFYFDWAPFLNFGRLRPLHTSAVIFAFGGNVLLATSFYVVQRTCRARLAGGFASWFVFWGYNLFIVVAGTGYLLGVTQGKEYAEPNGTRTCG